MALDVGEGPGASIVLSDPKVTHKAKVFVEKYPKGYPHKLFKPIFDGLFVGCVEYLVSCGKNNVDKLSKIDSVISSALTLSHLPITLFASALMYQFAIGTSINQQDIVTPPWHETKKTLRVQSR